MKELRMLHLLDAQHMMDVLLEALTALKPHMRVNVNLPHGINIHLAHLAFPRLRSPGVPIRHFLLHRPSVIHTERLGAFHDGPHLFN